MKSGFFTRKSAKEARTAQRPARAAVPAEALRRLGVAGVKDMNPHALHPDIQPHVRHKEGVWVLSDCPTRADDKTGKHLSGEAGALFWDCVSFGSVNFDYVVRTAPPRGRAPNEHEVECYRTAVVRAIEENRPKVILGLGPLPLRWMLDLRAIKAVRGKAFPVQVGKHQCWFLPTVHPTYLLKIAEKRDDKVPGKEWIRFFKRDVEKAFELLNADDPVIVPPSEAMAGVKHCMSIQDVREAVQHLKKCKEIGFDGEMHRTRPYYADSMFLSLALSDGEKTWSIPIDHPGGPWASGGAWALQRPVLIDLLRELLTGSNAPRWVAHNLPHDYEWLMKFLGREFVYLGKWGCSQQAAFALDPGPPGQGAAGHRLEDLCLQEYGLDIKGLTPGARWVARLRELPVEKVLDYNALDAKWCLRLWRRLRSRLREEGLMQSYNLQIKRIPAVVTAQFDGVPVCQEQRLLLEKDIKGQLEAVRQAIRQDKDVKAYEKKTSMPFQEGSPKVVGEFLGRHLRVPGVEHVPGSYTTKQNVLAAVRGDYPIVDNILKLRSLDKLLGTYVNRFDPKHAESYVYPDGKAHCRFSIARTRTARLASEEPNNQNWPKRKNKHVRKQLKAPPGYVWLSSDQGQIEARGLAMESCDPVWCRMLEHKYDVHAEWATKIAQIDTKFGAEFEKDPKAARARAKNQWVFPAFYGSSLKSIVNNIGLEDEEAAEDLFRLFWKVFRGVKQWQRRQWTNYERNYYVSSLTGRRRWGPLSYNMVINTPIQVIASDIVVDAMVRLHARSIREGLPWLSPRLQIHDDLSLLVPESELEYAITAVVEEQLGYRADWLNVPLSVEVEVGPDLATMEKIGEWSSADLS